MTSSKRNSSETEPDNRKRHKKCVSLKEESDDESNMSQTDSSEEDNESQESSNSLEHLKDEDPESYNELIKVKEELQRTEPDVKDLLKTPLRLEDRARLCQFYEIYKTHEPNTEEWLEARIRYNTMFKEFKSGFKQHNKFSEEEHKKMEEEEQLLISHDTQLTLKYKILSLNTKRDNKAIIYRKYEELSSLDTTSEEYSKLKHWLKWATEIPHDNIKQINVKNVTNFIKKASDKLDKELYGMNKVKEQILLFLSSKIINPHMKKTNLGLVGPPGVGKTAIARMISELIECGFEQISFGGIDRAEFLKGHEYTYVGAQPGAIVKCLHKMGHKNGVIFLDELDKAARHPDISAALLHLVDQSQNYDFRDNFIGEVSIDLSHIWYVGSMNKIPEDEALADRWWIIEIEGYNKKEKAEIIESYLLPKAITNAGMDEKMITCNKEAINFLIDKICNDNNKGVRNIQKIIADLINKIHFIFTHQQEDGSLPFKTSFKVTEKLKFPFVITKELISKFIQDKDISKILCMMYI
tara:strand:- start:3107 stop:4681 length:1575 start_codon:yes stop_codon:yes gene_type:complete